MTITLVGVPGYLAPASHDSTVELATTLVCQGYGVKINAIPVAIEHGPGVDTLVWAAGDYVGQAVPRV